MKREAREQIHQMQPNRDLLGPIAGVVFQIRRDRPHHSVRFGF